MSHFKLKLNEFVQTKTAQIDNIGKSIIQPTTGLIVQFQTARLPIFLNLITLTNHFEIINACKTIEERIFYVIYSHKERLKIKELQRCGVCNES